MKIAVPFRSFAELNRLLAPDEPVVTLFSGGLDSSYLLLRLKQLGFTDVHALSVNVGELETEAEKIDLAGRLGAKLHVVDQRSVFAEEFVGAAIRAHAVYLDLHPVSSTLSRPLIARCATELAQGLGSRAIVHTANRSQNTLRRLNGSLQLLDFRGHFGSPYDLQPVSREEKIAALAAAGVTFTTDRAISGDSNLWCREFESGYLDDPEQHAIPEGIWEWTRTSTALREADETLTIGFSAGLPITVDGHRLPLAELIGHLNSRVGRLGLGRYTGLEHLDHGEKVIEVREMPAAWLLLRTLRHLESATLEAETMRTKQFLEQVWVREAVEGRWFGPLRAAADAFIETVADRVSGTVTWRLHNGVATTASITSADPLYIRDREAWEASAIQRELETFHSLAT